MRDTRAKKVVIFIILIVLGIFILFLLTQLRNDMMRSSNLLEYAAFNKYHTYFVLCGISFGLLLGWKNIGTTIKEGIKINWLAIPAVIMLVIVFYPYIYWVMYFGLPPRENVILNILSSYDARIAMSIFTGFLITNCFSTVPPK